MMMNKDEIKAKLLSQLKVDEIHPLHNAMLDEICEEIAKNKELENTITLSAMSAFLASMTTMKSTISGIMEGQDADQVTLNYRNQQFIITKNDPLLK